MLDRHGGQETIPAAALPALGDGGGPALARIAAERRPVLGLSMARPQFMGVLNITPDSFSDGGRFGSVAEAVSRGLELVGEGAGLIDVGGESTRPGADPVEPQAEMDRVMPVIEGLIAANCPAPISIDTRNGETARAALAAGARLFNDISALSHGADSLEVAADAGAVCLMHAQGDPRTMHENPSYDDVLLDVYDYLAARIEVAVAAGIERDRIIVDPGIGFGKTLDHNLELLRGISLFHGLGCPLMLGVSRKRFIGTLSNVGPAQERIFGSIAAGIAALDQGVQILRVHDVKETVEAFNVWQAIRGGAN